MIGIFDSGSGGLSVLRALRIRAPQLDVVYFGDLANMPYGSKSQAELQRLTIDALQLLRAAGAHQLVSACNSVSASVIRPMMELFGVNEGSGVIEMVGPTVRAVAALGKIRVAVVATPATVESGMYQQEFMRAGCNATMIACPNLAASIEHEDDVLTRVKVDEAVTAAIAVHADVLVLACTHYPFARDLFEKLFARYGAEHIKIIDPADAVAEEIIARCGSEGNGALRFIVSEKTFGFSRRVEQLFTRNNCVPCIESIHATSTPKI